MAARIEAAPRAPHLVDLRHLSSGDLEDLLEEETQTWLATLNWDFGKSADLVRRFVDLRALNGCALMQDREVIGYAYYVLEEHKGLVGDLYVRRHARSVENENLLLESVLDALLAAPYVARVESQLMMIDSTPERPMPQPRYMRAHYRNFMALEFAGDLLPPGRVRHKVYLERWGEHHQDAAAQVIAGAYLGHIDSSINDQYRSPAGARKFLFNIVQYPGCGSFFRPASFAAFEALSGRMCGLCLASLVAPDAGHITQICVTPRVRGAGVGYELLRQSLNVLRDAGCRMVSLTVTSANQEAIQLYERVGFRTRRTFAAYVWEGF
jgi:ribosomal protein S18 acetylase RimI-like enzyme